MRRHQQIENMSKRLTVSTVPCIDTVLARGGTD
jgi:hypothetical protein